MQCRPTRFTNAYGFQRRVEASQRSTRLGAAQNPGSIFPGPRIVDDFTRLVEANSRRLKKLKNEKSSEEQQSETHLNSYDLPKAARASGQAFTSISPSPEDHDGVEEACGSQRPKLQEDVTKHPWQSDVKNTEPNILYYVQNVEGRAEGASRLIRNYKSSKPAHFIDHAAIHEELDNVLDAFRNTSSTSSPGTEGPLSTSSPVVRSQNASSASSTIPKYNVKPHIRHSVSSRAYSTLTGSSKSSSSPPVPLQSKTSPQQDNTHGKKTTIHNVPAFAQENSALQQDIGGDNIRQHLRQWQAYRSSLQDYPSAEGDFLRSSSSSMLNGKTQSGEDDLLATLESADNEEDDAFFNFDPEDVAMSIQNGPKFLKQGDLVDLQAANGLVLAIFIKRLDETALFYTERGSWIYTHTGRCSFAVPGFLDPGALTDILPFFPDDPHHKPDAEKVLPMSIHAPRGAGRQALEAMHRFRKHSDDLYRSNADNFNHAYDTLAPNAYIEGHRTLSLLKITQTLFNVSEVSKVTETMLWTTHRTMTRLENVYKSSRQHRQDPHFVFIPKQNLEHLKMTQEWMREFQEQHVEAATTALDNSGFLTAPETISQNPIASFVAKVRKVILLSRQKRPVSPTGAVGPSRSSSASCDPGHPLWNITPIESFSRTDKIILHYIDAWVTAKSLHRHGSLTALGPMVMRAVGLYDNLDLDQSAGYTFLQELGIISPWQNPSLHEIRTGLPGHNPFDTITLLREEARRQLPLLELKDTMASFRKDWGDIPVFCIDSESTVERDDGLSVEDVDGNPSEAWLHVHVANPTAFIPPTSSVAQYAAELSQSVYLPEQKYSMIDPKLSADHFSLDRDRPCITFSARIDNEGNILETTISHGTLRNVHHLTPEMVKAELNIRGNAKSPSTMVLNVGRLLPNETSGVHSETLLSNDMLSQNDIEQLRRILALGKEVRKRRGRDGAVTFPSTHIEENTMPEVILGRGSNVPDAFSMRAQHFVGDPVICLRKSPANDGPGVFVSDLMVLAGEICAQWCSKRRISIPYRGMQSDPHPVRSAAEYKRDILDPSLSKPESFDYMILVDYIRLLGYADLSASPLEHPVLGLPAYAKATSPLRRYNDLFIHWQIEAAIRQESKEGTSLVEREDRSFLPFSQSQVESVTKQLKQRERAVGHAEFSSWLHWHTLALFRAFYFKEAPLPETFEVKVRPISIVRDNVFGILKPWGGRVELLSSPLSRAQDGYQTADVWEAKIVRINVYNKSILMEPVRLITRAGG